MDFANYWFQGQADGPDPGGDVIGQSLRFRGAENLARALTQNPTGVNVTYSFWFKIQSSEQTKGSLFAFGSSNYWQYETGGIFRAYGGGSGDQDSTARFRDPGAWYNLVIQSDGNHSGQAWLNGENITGLFPIPDFPSLSNSGGTFEIGSGPGNVNFFQGYMADWYCIDGQALEPTAFGRFNDDGVWVPREVDFTPAGPGDDFIWSTNCFSAADGSTGFDFTGRDKNFAGGVNNLSEGFDGDNSSFTFALQNQSINFVNDFTGVNEIMVRTDTTVGYEFALNENPITVTRTVVGPAAEQVFNLPADFDGNVSMISIRGTNTTMTPGFSGIFINGQPLVDGVNNSYGPNGFHLTFADPDDLGHDSSGNENHFTPNGFNTDPVGIFSEDCFREPYANGTTPNLTNFATTTDQNNIQSPLVDGFNGTDDNGSLFEGGAMVFRPATPIENVTRIRSLQYGSQRNALNGTNLNNTSATNSDEVIYDGAAVTLTTWGAWSTTGNNGGWRTLDVSINGGDWITLVDNTGTDYDLMQDSPTQNYATLNPLYPFPSSASLFNANLAVVDSNGGFAPVIPSTMEATGKCYWEVVVSNVQAAYPYIGFSPLKTNPEYSNDGWLKNNCFSVAADGYSRNFGTVTASDWVTYGPGDVIGFAYDSDSKQITLTKNGGDSKSWTSNVPGPVAPLIAGALGSSATINYGQQPFASTPPAGFEALQTQNMPAATIANGRDHFQAITDTGANILTAAQTAFPNGLWWIKDRVNSNQHQFVDSVRGGNLSWQSPAGSSIERAYVAPAGNSVAWCWNAGGAAVTNNDGSLESQVSANTDAGFSIVSYTGNTSSNQTIGHGLTEPPEMVFTQNLDVDRWCAVYHNSLPLSGENTLQFLMLGESAGATNGGGANGIWNDQRPDENVFHVGTNDNHSNGNGNRMIAYCWHSVPGYSAFGSYEGNGNEDGPFIYTGHSVAWIMVKSTNGAGSWMIYDSARDPHNPVNHYLYANLPDGEAPNLFVDFLSNGFKMRNVTTSTNTSNINYVYAAFAENPFQAPVTAR